jgi:hypothetical protein
VKYALAPQASGGRRDRDGSLNVRLDAVPVNGTMHIREHKSHQEREIPIPTDGDLAVADALAH